MYAIGREARDASVTIHPFLDLGYWASIWAGDAQTSLSSPTTSNVSGGKHRGVPKPSERCNLSSVWVWPGFLPIPLKKKTWVFKSKISDQFLLY